MGNSLPKFAVVLVAATFISGLVLGQSTTTVSGNVHNALSKEQVPAVSVRIKGSRAGTFTDDRGNFKLVTDQKPPFVLEITSIGYEPLDVPVNEGTAGIQINLTPAVSLGTEVVISASRVPERILESPVSIERV